MAQTIEVLIIDNSPTQALRLQMILEKNGYTVTVARDSVQALNFLNDQFFQIIIVDWEIPEVNGREFCSIVRSKTFADTIYILMQTSQDKSGEIAEGLAGGADDYLIKPVNTVELISRLTLAKRITSLENELKTHKSNIEVLSITDILTHVYNRRYLVNKLPDEIKRACRYERPLAVAICDVDQFKDINKQYGHHTGDNVLKNLGQLLFNFVRKDIDWVARYGDDKFIIVMPETDHDGAMLVSERLRNNISEQKIAYPNDVLSITASFGVSCLHGEPDEEKYTPDELIRVADNCLSEAKKDGGNNCKSAYLKKR